MKRLRSLKKLLRERRKVRLWLREFGAKDNIPGIPASEVAWLKEAARQQLGEVEAQIMERTGGILGDLNNDEG